MRDLVVLFIHFIATLARLLGPGGARSIVAESLLLKHQLLILNRSRHRSPNLCASDRILAGLMALWVRPIRLLRSAIVLKPSTLLGLHKALSKQKYRMLFSPNRRRKPGPKGPSAELIDAVLAMKQRNPRWGCPRIAQQIALAFHALCRMFNRAIRGQRWMPKYLSSDHDPLYKFHQWQANLRILEVTEIKSIPCIPLSHPFVERLIGTIRRECLDHTLFWTTVDLQNKLLDFRNYFNNHRTHNSLKGRTPDTPASPPVANLRSFRWQPHCRGLYQTPVAA